MPRTPSSPDDLLDDAAARDIALTADELSGLLAEGQAAGKVSLWHQPGEASSHASLWITLTPASMAELNLQLSVTSDRFLPIGKAWTEKVQRQKGQQELHHDPQSLFAQYRPGDESRYSGRDRLDPSVYADPTCPEPLDVLVDDEASGDFLRDGSRVVVRHVLGIRPIWPQGLEPAEVRIEADTWTIIDSVCRGCLGKRLARNAYCCICGRSGVDGKLLPIELDLRQTGRKKYSEPDVGGGTGPARKRA